VPIPEELHRSHAPSWSWPANQRVEYMIALYITAGWVTGDPRYGDPATRLADIAVQRFGTAADDAVNPGCNGSTRPASAGLSEPPGGALPSRQTSATSRRGRFPRATPGTPAYSSASPANPGDMEDGRCRFSAALARLGPHGTSAPVDAFCAGSGEHALLIAAIECDVASLLSLARQAGSIR
jgi:hypothetical protein